MTMSLLPILIVAACLAAAAYSLFRSVRPPRRISDRSMRVAYQRAGLLTAAAYGALGISFAISAWVDEPVLMPALGSAVAVVLLLAAGRERRHTDSLNRAS